MSQPLWPILVSLRKHERMKHFFLSLFLVFFSSLFCLAQATWDNAAKKSERVIVLSGGGLNFSRAQLMQSAFFSIETPVGNFWNLGILGGYVFTNELNNPIRRGGGSFYKFRGGFEVGGFSKYFLHGRYSGRKSEFYWGPEFRLGSLHSEGQYYGDVSPSLYVIKNTRHTKQYLIRWGAQWRFERHFVCELAIPLGWEYSKDVTRFIENDVEQAPTIYKFDQFVMRPSFQLGFAF